MAENEHELARQARGEQLYLDTLGQECFMTPNRARALIQELTNWLTEKAQIAVNLYGDS